MISPTTFFDLVSGRRRGLRASALRGALALCEPAMYVGVQIRNWRYDRGKAAIYEVPVPVISVGNLTLGGTGKTPMVEWICRRLRARQIRVAIISRGYGAQAGSANDEALELEQRLPDVPPFQNPDRYDAATTAILECESQILVLDDAFQHRRLKRDLDIVLIDALNPFGFNRLFPRGLLREPLCGLGRAHVAALSRADMATAEERQAIQTTVRRYAPQIDWIECSHRADRLISSSGGELALKGELAGQPVAAFCGIGNPAGFRHTLASSGFHVAAFREFPDHHAYSREDIESLRQWADSQKNVKAVLCTHKDLVKIGLDHLGGKPLWALVVRLEILAGEELLQSHLEALLPRVGNS